MVRFARSLGISVREASQKVNKVTMSVSASALVALGSAVPAFAAPATGNTDVDEVVTGFEAIYGVAKAGFKYLAIASIVVTTLVLAFFWLRGKLKQAVSGS